MTSRKVAILAVPGIQLLDAAGPAEVFNTAARLREGAYEVELVAPGDGPLRSSSLTLVPDRSLAACRGPLDTLLVAGGAGTREASQDRELIAWLGAAARRSRRVGSVCTGSFLLAAAGLLDGRRATTHWGWCQALAREYPDVEVVPDSIYVRHGELWTSAGVTAGIDLALAMVEDDLGRDVALEVARHLVVFLQRPGGQAQFSAQLSAQRAERAPLREVQGWIVDNLEEDLSVPALAERASMSERSFARAFAREVGITPAAYVERARVERARMALESGAEPVEGVAHQVGFGTVETMRRAFSRRLGVSPAAYRSRFSPKEAA